MTRGREGAASADSSASDFRALGQLLDMPLSFLGFALWRAWVSLAVAGPAYPLPLMQQTGQLAYDMVLAVTCLVAALLSKRLSPLNGRPSPYFLAGALMTGATAANVAAIFVPSLSALAPLCAAASGIGSALLILLWCEIYGCLSPVRTAVYYALALIMGVFLTFVLEGFKGPWFYGALAALPIMSAGLAYRSYHRRLAPQDRPASSYRTLVPWKFIAVVALYEVVSGLSATYIKDSYGNLVGPHSTAATLLAGIALFVWVFWLSDRFPLSMLYRAPVVIVACGLVALPLLGLSNGVAGALCVSMGTTLFSCVVFLFLCDISKRLGIAALCLFGIEETLIPLKWGGTVLGAALQSGDVLGVPTQGIALLMALALVIGLPLLLVNDREVGTRWGITLLGKAQCDAASERREEALCEQLAAENGLTPRETEVIALLAQGKSLSQVASSLFIAEGTAKAHTRHIYEKLGINTRQELFDMLKVNPKERS
ncbi:hypothetical protein B5F40_06335 [Gordonibacter sp. An230]|uniref:helix-turn-helix transcriptional regulator n=1 Tax=Gordonibacter sp. An230 TaxID=1965592 RepID=UPI000B3667D9|nr:helix-turn-helix transcriptional regulator [Gordonibacter sp. An230]OUO90626.1 hypothetical protein B5F40_06335 [Gordonibacter sp. An230]